MNTINNVLNALNERTIARQIGIPHTQIDNILTRPPFLHLDLVDRGKHIGRQAIKPCKFCIHAFFLFKQR